MLWNELVPGDVFFLRHRPEERLPYLVLSREEEKEDVSMTFFNPCSNYVFSNRMSDGQMDVSWQVLRDSREMIP